MNKLLLVVFLLTLASGCTIITQPAQGGLKIELSASPPQVFAGKEAVLYTDVQNNDKTAHNINYDVFDKGRLSSDTACLENNVRIEKGNLKSFRCILRAPRADLLPENRIDNDVWARIDYDSTLSAMQMVKVISQQEYELRQRSGKLVKEPASYSFMNKDTELLVEFSSELPLVSGRKDYIYFTIKNTGSGFIGSINMQIQDDNNILDSSCRNRQIIMAGKASNRIACELATSQINNYLSNPITINIDYNYEVRNKITIPIIK